MQPDIQGIWFNEHGSLLDLRVSEQGDLTGTFRSATGLPKGTEDVSVTGFTSGHLVSFVANFGLHGSLTAWTGHVVGEGSDSLMELSWHMSVALPGRERVEELWRGVWTGTDVFRRQRPKPQPSPSRLPSHPLPEWP